MAKAKSPFFSLGASKQIGKALIFKQKGSRSFVTRYNKPGGQNPFIPSASQLANRVFYAAAVQVWRDKTADQKAYWNDLVREKKLSMSGWNLFYKTAFTDPEGNLGTARYGIRVYGYYRYGKIVLE